MRELSTDGDKEKSPQPTQPRPEREATFKDYLRIFSYAEKFDYALMVAASLASVGAGIVRPRQHSTCSVQGTNSP